MDLDVDEGVDVGVGEGVDVGTSVSTKVLVSDKVLTDVDNGRVGGGQKILSILTKDLN